MKLWNATIGLIWIGWGFYGFAISKDTLMVIAALAMVMFGALLFAMNFNAYVDEKIDKLKSKQI